MNTPPEGGNERDFSAPEMVNRRVDKNLAGYSDAFAVRDRLKAEDAREQARRLADAQRLEEKKRREKAELQETA